MSPPNSAATINTPSRARRFPTARATQKRRAILGAAELLFAESGFEATRLEDVAKAVGIRRASLVYYFNDKRSLYDAVLAGLVGDLAHAIALGLDSNGTLASRIQTGVGSWVDFLLARPTFARLLLREVADAAPGGAPAPLAAHLGGVHAAARALLGELERAGGHFPDAVDPAHFASAIAGATVLYATALPSLAPNIETGRIADDLEGVHQHHRSEVVRIAQRLLGDIQPRELLEER